MVSAREAAELQQGVELAQRSIAANEKWQKEKAERNSRIQDALAVRPRGGAPTRHFKRLATHKNCGSDTVKLKRAKRQQHETSEARTHGASKARISTPKPIGLHLRSPRTTQSRSPSPTTSNGYSSRQQIICDCAHALPRADEIFIVCQSCLNLQHPACATPDDAIGKPEKLPRCNDCKKAELHRHITIQRQRIQNLGKMVSRMVAGAQDFYPKDLWKHYCNLPKGCSSDAVIAITQTTYEQGAMVPVHSAPQSWIDKVIGCLTKMRKDAGEDVVNSVIGPNRLEAFSDLSDLVQWRELAKWLLHKGPYKGRKAELGILAEILGFEEKGTFWDGGWMDDFLDPLRHSEE